MESDRDSRFISRRKFLTATAAGLSSLALAACGGGGTTTEGGATAGTGGEAGTTGGGEAATAAGEVVETATAAGGEGGTTGGGEAAEAATGEAAPTPTPEPTPTPVVLGTGGQKVQFWHGLGGADGATMVQMLQQYSADHPDIQLSSETYGWDVFYQKLPTATAAGTPPNLGIMHSWAIQQFADQGILQDADTVFFTEGLVPKDDFNQALIEAISVDGKTQAVPFDTHGWICWMNTKVIEDAGLNPDELPANGTEFIEWAKQVTVDEGGKHPGEDGFNPDAIKVFATHSSWQRFTLPSTIWQYGGGIFSEDGKTSLLNDPKTIAAVQYWHDLIFTHNVAPPATPGQASPPDLFKGNGIALMWDGTWSLNFFKDNPDAAEVMRPVPLNSLAPDGTRAVRFDSHMMVVPTGVADADLQARSEE